MVKNEVTGISGLVLRESFLRVLFGASDEPDLDVLRVLTIGSVAFSNEIDLSDFHEFLALIARQVGS